VAGSFKGSFPKLVSNGSKQLLSHQESMLLQNQEQLLNSLSRIVTEIQE
jgi:hypothetical protein